MSEEDDGGAGGGAESRSACCVQSMSSSSSPESAPGLAGGGATIDDDDDDGGGAAFAPPDFRAAIAFMRRLLMPGLMDRAAEADGLFGEEFSSQSSAQSSVTVRFMRGEEGGALEERVKPDVEETVISSSESESTGGGRAAEDRTVDMSCYALLD